MRRNPLNPSAVTIVAALGLCAVLVLGLAGCGQPAPPTTSPTPATSPAPSVGLPAPSPPARGGPPLPPPSALTDVMGRLADPAVPGTEKLTLIQSGAAGEAAGLDRFTAALRDNRALPLSFEARDLAWSQSEPGNVVATVVVRSADPDGGEFSFPMEFAPAADSWQLTQQSADLLLELDGQPAPPAPEPAPAPEPEPAPAPEPEPAPPPPATPTPTR